MIDPDLDEVRRLAIHVAAQAHTHSFDGTPEANQRLLTTADVITGWLTTDPAMTGFEQRLAALEAGMATLNEEMARIDAETNEIGDVVTGAITEIEDLRTRIADLDTAAAAQLGAIADRLSGTGDRLRAVAADPNNPVPAPEPGV